MGEWPDNYPKVRQDDLVAWQILRYLSGNPDREWRVIPLMAPLHQSRI